jgi:hypothetical protein
VSFDPIPLGEFESAGAAQFNEVGDKHVGRIVAAEKRPQTDMTTGKVRTFTSGQEMTQWVITIEKEDGTTAALYAKNGNFEIVSGSGEAMLRAIGRAVRAAGAESLVPGAMLAVAWTGMGKASGPGMNAPKLYTASYRPPEPAAVAVDDLFNDQ